MLRPTSPQDTEAIIALAAATQAFKPPELVALREVLDDYHATNQRLGHVSTTAEADGQVQGFVYFAPTAMTDRAWHLWWIAVSPDLQGQGMGGELLEHAEQTIEEKSGRILLIETSSQPHYERTRQFYQRHGYERAAFVPDYYADGDSLIIFRKRLDDAN